MSKVLLSLEKQRLTSAAEEIFVLFEKTIAEYEEELCRSKEENERLQKLLNTSEDARQRLVVEEEVPPDPKDHEDPDLPPQIKPEQEQLWTSQEGEELQELEEADITKPTFTPVPVKSEEKPQSLQLHQTGAYGEDCGGPETARDSDPESSLRPETEDNTGDAPEPDTEDMGMINMDQTFIRTAINVVLPNLQETTLKDILEETLRSIGVETYNDFQFIEEADLLSALKPIQARKAVAAWKQVFQSPETSSPSVSFLPGPAASFLSLSPRSSNWTDSASCRSPDVDCVDTFAIPSDKFPEQLIQTLMRGRRPSPKMRREMVRIVVCEMMQQRFCINKKNTTEVAKKMVERYPRSLQDMVAGEVIGQGYHSLVKQLQNRAENVKRCTIPKIRKRKHLIDESDTDEVPLGQRAAIQDTYGCINWDVKLLPLGETQKTQQKKREQLKIMSQQSDANPEEVKLLMKSTFYTQRQQVNQGKSIKQLLEEWPICFKELGMETHFKELTGSGLKETFTQNMDLKGKQLINYMNTVCVNKSKRFLQAVNKLNRMRGEESGCSEDIKEMLLLLLSYFVEKENVMFCYVPDTCLAEEVQRLQVNLTPTIVVCGRDCFSARRFMLSVDGSIVNDHIPSFISALCLMFGSYYCFNIHYPSELASTLEFLQRCFFSINPVKGTKVLRNTSSHLNVTPRVLTLIQELSDHQWRESADKL
ncbi:uncharacterized protein LOC134873015 [Eleginops maclovinus]|uniref:uncharacterized protein LOC134873015 n=1 Tax=Eleginops maclovinus TaxID=56733 RepID=UPI0030809063